MALQSSTVNETHSAERSNAEWQEAWRNAHDYLKALNVSESLRLRIQNQIFKRALELPPAEPVRFVMEQLFENVQLRRILANATHGVPTQPEIGFTSMLPERMDYLPVAKTTSFAARWIIAGAGILALVLALAFVVLQLLNFNP